VELVRSTGAIVTGAKAAAKFGSTPTSKNHCPQSYLAPKNMREAAHRCI
jgi:hypothetical protein